MDGELIVSGGLFVFVAYTACLILHLVVPSRIVTGYCCDSENQPLKYYLNGFVVLLLFGLIFYLIPKSLQSVLYYDYWNGLIAANIVGLTLSGYFFVAGGGEKYDRCVTIDQLGKLDQLKPVEANKHGALTTFFLGCRWNPRFFGGRLDVKMFLYIVGAIGLFLNILSCLSVHATLWKGNISIGMTVYCVCFFWFIGEYMLGEQVHLYTYDLFAEKIGFKLTWGCLVFYPFFYPIGAYSIVTANPDDDISPALAGAIAALFFSGWVLTRGANMQKFYFRTDPEAKTFLFGLVTQKTVPGTRILCSGWWGAARHLNYLGEIVQGVALALPGSLMGSSFAARVLPWLYPLYYVALFIPRQIDDDELCRKKYGKKWEEYEKLVPYRICPGVW